MEEFKGTKEEWVKVVEKSKILVKIPIRIYGKRIIYTELQLGYISDDDCGNPVCCCVEEHANASLIAAAPNLLEACQEALKELQFHNWQNTATGFKLEQAIEKALKL